MDNAQKQQRDEYVTMLCNYMKEHPSGIRSSCKAIKKERKDFPFASTLREWIQADKDYSEQYARAKQIQLQNCAEDLLDIADDTSNDYIIGEDGKITMNTSGIMRARLQVDTRKWLLSKLLPKQYGDKLEIESKHNHAVTFTIVNYGDMDKVQEITCKTPEPIQIEAAPVDNLSTDHNI